MQAKVGANCNLVYSGGWWLASRLRGVVTAVTALVYLDVDSSSVATLEALKLAPKVRTRMRVSVSTRLSTFLYAGGKCDEAG